MLKPFFVTHWTGRSRASRQLWLAWCRSFWACASCVPPWTASGTSSTTAPAVEKWFGIISLLCILFSWASASMCNPLFPPMNSAGGWVQEGRSVHRRRPNQLDRAELCSACLERSHETAWYEYMIYSLCHNCVLFLCDLYINKMATLTLYHVACCFLVCVHRLLGRVMLCSVWIATDVYPST